MTILQAADLGVLVAELAQDIYEEIDYRPGVEVRQEADSIVFDLEMPLCCAGDQAIVDKILEYDCVLVRTTPRPADELFIYTVTRYVEGG